MARNEEKQQGRLNRLWLQTERDEGRLKDVHERRPKLSTLNSVSSVKKWIPSIKNEIEYYLQQSQLSHYPERKIAEFQLHIEALQKEYKRFIAKLRVLDPSCKQKPWTPRAYCKRRADPGNSPVVDTLKRGDDLESTEIKTPRPSESFDGLSQRGGDESCSLRTGCVRSSLPEGPHSLSDSRFQTLSSISTVSESSEVLCSAQDQPLSFDVTRLAVAAAAFRGSSNQLNSSKAQNLAQVLQSGLPNLSNSTSRQTFSAHTVDMEISEGTIKSSVAGKGSVQEDKTGCEAAVSGKQLIAGTKEERTGHILGLECYSSSDEDTQ